MGARDGSNRLEDSRGTARRKDAYIEDAYVEELETAEYPDSRTRSRRNTNADVRIIESGDERKAQGSRRRDAFSSIEAKPRRTRESRRNRDDGDFPGDTAPSSRNGSRSSHSSRSSSSSRSRLRTERADTGRDAVKRTTSENANPERAGGKREARRRERTKARAERMYAKQFESDSAAFESDKGSPRAALYEGQMGSTHRRSARMQSASTATPQSAKLDPTGWFSGLNVSRRTLRAVTALVCVVLVGVFLYVPAQQYYQAQRQHDRLAAEYASLEQRNDALSTQNDSLSSDAGMEDAVRQKYGYVLPGDQSGVVLGLSDNTTDSLRNSEDIEANVLSSAVKAPEEWYTPYLDAFFGVS